MLSWYLVWAFVGGANGAMWMPDEAFCREAIRAYKAVHGSRVIADCRQEIRHG
jgi:hypothetical protein